MFVMLSKSALNIKVYCFLEQVSIEKKNLEKEMPNALEKADRQTLKVEFSPYSVFDNVNLYFAWSGVLKAQYRELNYLPYCESYGVALLQRRIVWSTVFVGLGLCCSSQVPFHRVRGRSRCLEIRDVSNPLQPHTIFQFPNENEPQHFMLNNSECFGLLLLTLTLRT